MAGEIGDYCGIDFIGGGLGAVDKIDGAVLQDKDAFLVVTPTVFAPLSLDADSGAAENSPQIIAPNTNPGTKRWVLTGGAFAGLTLIGPNSVVAGPHITLKTDEDVYPTIQIMNWAHDSLSIGFDAYYDGAHRSSDAGSNARIHKNFDKLSFKYNSGDAQGEVITWDDAIVIDLTNGRVGIGTATPISTAGGLDISSGGLSLIIGADAAASSRTDANEKSGRFCCAHYTNAEEPLGLLLSTSGVNYGYVFFGGGSALFNAATELRFYTAADNVTPTGTLRGTFDSAGDFNLTGSLKVDDIQVVSNQGAAVANATDPATTMARLNDLLARCRAHGLIAT